MNLNFSSVDWGPVAGQLMKIGAPLIGTIIGGPLGGVAGTIIGGLADTLGVPATPEAISQKLNDDPEAAAAVVALEERNRPALEAEVEKTRQVQIEQTNLSLRAEVAAGDRFQRWARPFNMYMLGGVTGCYGFCCVAAAVNTIVTKDPTALQHVVNLGASLTTVLIPCGAVAGVTAWQTSKEKIAGVFQRPASAATVLGKVKK